MPINVILGTEAAGAGVVLDEVPEVGDIVEVTANNCIFTMGIVDEFFIGESFHITTVTEVPGRGYICGIANTQSF